ncbi:MAG TPA: hypothetical protein P5026_08235 [Kiritimatiellia bacterium]|nr:hypothetical protein [Kiritimatiellia bacterium]
MGQVKRTLEITLHSIHIPVTGAGLDTTTSHLLTAELVWPRTGTARKSASQSITLRKGSAELAALNWGRRILFKENVEGRFALAVTVTESLDDEELEKILRFWAGAALGIGAEAADDAAGPLGDLAAAPLKYAAKAVAKYPGASLLVEGLAELDAADFPTSGGERLLTVRLAAARTLLRVSRRTVNSRSRVSRKTLLEKGADNGAVTLSVRSL